VPIEKNIISRTENGVNFMCNADKNVSSNTFSSADEFAHTNIPPGLVSPDTYYNVPIVFIESGCK